MSRTPATAACATTRSLKWLSPEEVRIPNSGAPWGMTDSVSALMVLWSTMNSQMLVYQDFGLASAPSGLTWTVPRRSPAMRLSS